MNKNLEFKFEKVTSHLDTNKCSDPILLHGKPLEVGQLPGWVDMNPTSLPELFKPPRDLGNPQNPET